MFRQSNSKMFFIGLVVMLGVQTACPASEAATDETPFCPMFNFDNALAVTFRLYEEQSYSLNGNPLQNLYFETAFNVVSVEKRDKGLRVEIQYVDFRAYIQGAAVMDTRNTPALKEAAEDIVGRCLIYELDGNHRVLSISGVKELLAGPGGRMFGTVMNEAIFKRSLEKLLLSREDISRPLQPKDSWQWRSSQRDLNELCQHRG